MNNIPQGNHQSNQAPATTTPSSGKPSGDTDPQHHHPDEQVDQVQPSDQQGTNQHSNIESSSSSASDEAVGMVHQFTAKLNGLKTERFSQRWQGGIDDKCGSSVVGKSKYGLSALTYTSRGEEFNDTIQDISNKDCVSLGKMSVPLANESPLK